MPRLTAKHYLQRRAWFVNLWRTSPGQLALISFTDQRHLHDYFRPEQDWSDIEALDYRKRISQIQPAVPQCAGRAATHLFDAVERAAAQKAVLAVAPAYQKRSNKSVLVRGEVRSEINTNQLVKALLAAVREIEVPEDRRPKSRRR